MIEEEPSAHFSDTHERGPPELLQKGGESGGIPAFGARGSRTLRGINGNMTFTVMISF